MRERLASWAVPVGIYVVAVAVYALLGSLQDVPLVSPDEFRYAHLARSLAEGDGFSFYGSSVNQTTPLFLYLLAPSWLIASGESAYELAKLTGALAVCTVVFPVWALARRTIPGPAAALPVVLTLAGTWMISAAGLMSENLAFPLATASLVSAVLALREPHGRWAWLALAFAVAATLARVQLAVLFPIMLAGLLIDAWASEDPSGRLRRVRVELVALGAIVVVGAIVVSSSSSILGTYAGFGSFRPSISLVLAKAAEQWLALTIACGVAPLAVVLTAMSTRSAWSDADLGPVLAMTAPTVGLLVLQSGFFNAGFSGGIDWSIERYVQYAMPLLFVGAVLAVCKRAAEVPRLVVIGGATALALLGTPAIRQAIEEHAQYGTWKLIDDIVAIDPWIALTVVALVVVLVSVWLVRRFPPIRASIGVSAVVCALLILQGRAIWNWQIDFASAIRAEYPAQLDWVDRHARGPASRIYFFQNSTLFEAAAMFNDDVAQVLRPPAPTRGPQPLGPICTWAVGTRGELMLDRSKPGCHGPLRSRVWNDDPFIEMSFHGGRTLARDAFLGQVIAVPPRPRLRSLIRKPCQRATIAGGRDGSPVGIPKSVRCTPHFSVNLWVDSPGTLELTLGGGARAQHVRQGRRSWTLPAGRDATLRVPVSSAVASLLFHTDWRRSAGTPRIVRAAFVTDAGSQSLL